VNLADLIFTIVGVGALAAALLPHLAKGRPFSLPIAFLAAGALIGVLPAVSLQIRPLDHPSLVEHAAEVIVIVALMGAGLGLDRRIGLRSWSTTWRLLAFAMPLTIVAIGGIGWALLGLPLASALLLGATLAPTDPVLAGEVQVGEPASKASEENNEDEVRFSLTSEAGLNDALAFPFVFAAIAMAEHGADPSGWAARWFTVDVLYRLAVGVFMGWAVGKGMGRLFFSSKTKSFGLAEHREGFVALAATFLTYGVTETAHGYGFLAVFISAITIRNSERFDGYHKVLHGFVEQIERLLTVLMLLLVGMAIADGALEAAGWRELLFAAVVLVLVRPICAGVSLLRSRGSKVDRMAIAFFGVRGIGSIYYIAYAVATGDFTDDAPLLLAVVGLVVTGSVLLHGVTAGPAIKRLDARRE
jgi:NhaP-type Na+/H+ or K+/H+ antiporter